MLKTITGEPRSGKSYLIVHLLLNLYFKWCPNIFQWMPKDDVEQPVILTNIDGLRIPHIKLQDVIKELNIPLPTFLTLRHFIPWMEKHDKPVVLVIDEAQANFPFDFRDDKYAQGGKDPQGSTFYFFEYHGHHKIDIYLLAQQWTRLSQNIVKNSEYQIQAIPETYRQENTLRYKYIDPKSMAVIDTQSIKKDSKVFMAYRSSNGEHKTNRKKPVKKLVVMVSMLVMAFVAFACTTYYRILPSDDELQAVQTSKPQAAPVPQLSSVDLDKIKKKIIPRADDAPLSLKQPELPEKQFTQVKLGGAWIGKKLIAVDFFGTLVPIRDFPYSLSEENNHVYAYVPDEVLTMAKPGLWVDSHRVISTTEEIDEENQPQRKSNLFSPLNPS